MREAAFAELVNAELCRRPCGAMSERKAEVVAMLRLSGSLQFVAGRVVLVADLGAAAVTERLRREVNAVYGYGGQVGVLRGRGTGGGHRHLLRITRHGPQLARQTGLVDPRGRPVRGLPPAVVSGSVGDAAAVWRGAFLARGSVSELGRSAPSVGVACPSPEVALALVGAARRLGVTAKARETREGLRVDVREVDEIAELLIRMGARTAVTVWRESRARTEAASPVTRLASFDEANLRRSSIAAARTTARVRRALEILAEDIPEQLLTAAELRLRYERDSLERLGQRADPPMTKDAVAGRIRRLLVTADTVAHDLGIPDTQCSIP